MRKRVLGLFLAASLMLAIGCSSDKGDSSTYKILSPVGSFSGANEDSVFPSFSEISEKGGAWGCDDSLKVFSFLEKVHLNGERITSEKRALAREAVRKIFDKGRIPTPLISVSKGTVSYVRFIPPRPVRKQLFLDQIEDEKKYCATVEEIASAIETDGAPIPSLSKEELLSLVHKGILRYFIASLDPHSWMNEGIEFQLRRGGDCRFFDADPDEHIFRIPPHTEDNPFFNLPKQDSLHAHFGNDLLAIELFRFDENTVRDFKSEYEAFVSSSDKRKGLIIDLRRNGGGSASAVAGLADLFLKEGPTLVMREKSGEDEWKNNIGHAESGNELTGIESLPIVILISRYSASASEIFASIMKDYYAAVIIGERSFGKGTGQINGPLRAFPLGIKSEVVIAVTTDYTYSPSGRPLQFEGVEPDVYVYDHDYRDCLDRCAKLHERWIDRSTCCEEAFFEAQNEKNFRNAVAVPPPQATQFKEPPMTVWWPDLKRRLLKYFSDHKGNFRFGLLVDFFKLES